MNFLLSRADVAPGTGEAEQLAVMHQIFARDYLIHIDTILSVIAYRHYCDNSKIGQSGYLFDHLDEFYEKTMAANIL